MTQQRRVLVADDASDIGVLFAMALGLEGVEVVTVADGHSAVDAIAQRGPFDVVVLDVQMPDLDGWETLALVRDRPDPPPVVLCSVKSSDADRRRAAAAGAHDYIVKPFDVAATVQRIIAIANRRSSAPPRG